MTRRFSLANGQFSMLQTRKKVYSLMHTGLRCNDAVFRLSAGMLDMGLVGTSGLVKTTFETDYSGETVYFTVDYQKFDTVLQKFLYADVLEFELSGSLLRLFTESGRDTVNLQATVLDAESSEADMLDTYADSCRAEYMNQNHVLSLTDDVRSGLSLFSALFGVGSKVNSIGLSSDRLVFSDRSVVIREHLAEPLPEVLFDGSEDGYAYLHVDTVRLMDVLCQYRNEFCFDDAYDIMYWSDGPTVLIYQSDSKNVVLPTEEQWEGIKPFDPSVRFSFPLASFASVLDFFNGIYMETGWKPLEFVSEDGAVCARYRNPLAEASKVLDGVECPFQGRFTVDADTLRAIVSKEKAVLPEDTSVSFGFDADGCKSPAPGVYLTIGEGFEAVVSKLDND